jgi:hypothetical protein
LKRYRQRPVATSQVSSTAQAALLAQPQKAAAAPDRGTHRRLGPQLVDALHSQRPAVQRLPAEHALGEVQVRAMQWPVAPSQRPGAQAREGLTRQSGVQTPRELSVVTDSHT